MTEKIHGRSRRALALCLSLLAAGAVGCGAATAAGPAGPSGNHAFTTAPAKPNGAGIRVSYRVDGTAIAGQAIAVVVVLDQITDGQAATVRFEADPGLSLPDAPPGAVPLAAGQAATFTLSVVPAADGLRYVNIFTTQDGATGSTSVPIQTGEGAGAVGRKPAGTLRAAPNGDAILSMPVK